MINYYINYLLFKLFIILHWIVFILMVSALPWSVVAFVNGHVALWQVVICWVTVFRTAFSPNMCPLSMAECYFAKKIDQPEKKYFVKSYVIPMLKTVNKKVGQCYHDIYLHMNSKGQ